MLVGGRPSFTNTAIYYSFRHKNEGDKFEKEVRFVFHESWKIKWLLPYTAMWLWGWIGDWSPFWIELNSATDRGGTCRYFYHYDGHIVNNKYEVVLGDGYEMTIGNRSSALQAAGSNNSSITIKIHFYINPSFACMLTTHNARTRSHVPAWRWSSWLSTSWLYQVPASATTTDIPSPPRNMVMMSETRHIWS